MWHGCLGASPPFLLFLSPGPAGWCLAPVSGPGGWSGCLLLCVGGLVCATGGVPQHFGFASWRPSWPSLSLGFCGTMVSWVSVLPGWKWDVPSGLLFLSRTLGHCGMPSCMFLAQRAGVHSGFVLPVGCSQSEFLCSFGFSSPLSVLVFGLW